MARTLPDSDELTQSSRRRGDDRSHLRRYGFGYVTGALFLVALVGHWWLAWHAHVAEQVMHGRDPDVAGYLIEVGRDTLENWQSEFLQLLWQVAGLSFLFYLGSPASKEGDDRMEAKLDEVLRRLDAKGADATIEAIDDRYGGRQTDPGHPSFKG
jgi:hypothetical protein